MFNYTLYYLLLIISVIPISFIFACIFLTNKLYTTLQQILVRSCTYRNGKSSVAVRYFVTSLTDIDEFAHSVREHWAIENKLHWSLDVIFREDSDLARKHNAPLNLNILDKTALYLISQADMGNITRKRKRFRAALDSDALLSVILSPK